MVSVSIVLVCLFVLLCGAPTLGQHVMPGPADHCIEEALHLDAPSPETDIDKGAGQEGRITEGPLYNNYYFMGSRGHYP